jgi:aminoglycoside 3-N-acetyltransferase
MGVNHTVNTSIHLAEQFTGRTGFTRWAIQDDKIVTCLHFPGCSNGFNEAAEALQGISSHIALGDSQLIALPMQAMIEILTMHLQKNPLAMLCNNPHCQRCQEYRRRYTEK